MALEMEAGRPLRALFFEAEERMDDSPPTMTAANFCRGRPDLRWGNRPLHHIGRRAARSFFLAHDTGRNVRSLVSVVRVRYCTAIAPASAHHARVAECIRHLHHPYVCTPTAAKFMPDSEAVVIVRPLYSGTVRDYLHGRCAPLTTFADKYTRSVGQPLALDKLAAWTAQVLSAVHALQAAGVRLSNVHAGNVAIADDGTARLLDLETELCAAVPDPYVERHVGAVLERDRRAGGAACEPEVVQAGLLIFEMATGWRLEDPGADLVGLALAPAVHRLLQRIFAPSHPKRITTISALRRVAFLRSGQARREPVESSPELAQVAADAAAVVDARRDGLGSWDV